MGEIGIGGKTLKSESFDIEELWKGARWFYFLYVAVKHIVTRYITYHLLDGAAVVGNVMKMYLCQVFGTDLILWLVLGVCCVSSSQYSLEEALSLFRTYMLYVF